MIRAFHSLRPALERVGASGIPRVLLCGATALLCIASSVDFRLLTPWFGDHSPSRLSLGIMLLTAAAAVLVSLAPKGGIPLTWALAAVWIAAALASGFRLILAQSVPIAVAFAEATVLATGFLVLMGRVEPRRILPPIMLALALFGMVHILMRKDLAGLVPAVLPYGEAWPLFTGSMMLMAAAAIPFDRTRIYALATVALMFLTWLPVVHAPRLLASPDAGEVIFAATDVALIGALVLATRARPLAA